MHVTYRLWDLSIQICQRMITVLTMGALNTVKKLASHKLQSTLVVRLAYMPQIKDLRETIVPSAKAYPLDALLKDYKDYFGGTSRRVSFG
ncbi:hypothetical protein MKX03_004441, partial [Papaver bracteatum]